MDHDCNRLLDRPSNSIVFRMRMVRVGEGDRVLQCEMCVCLYQWIALPADRAVRDVVCHSGVSGPIPAIIVFCMRMVTPCTVLAVGAVE